MRLRSALLHRLDRSRHAERGAALAGGLAALPFALLVGAAAALTPPGLDAPPAASAPATPSTRATSAEVTGRDGEPLRELLAEGGFRARPLRLENYGERLPAAVIAAEDKRFFSHHGVDPLASARALASSVAHGRVTSGASTLTQQLARNLIGAPRNASGKARVLALSLRLEAEHDKAEILGAYLARIEFGNGLRGAEAAAQYYFDKPSRDLSLAEAATLASLPRGPTLYDPKKNPDRLLARRDRVLERMADAGLATDRDVELAKGEPLVLAPRFRGAPAPHFVSAVAQGTVDACSAPAPLPRDAVRVRTTIEAALQRQVVASARATVQNLGPSGVSAASVVVLDNGTGDILAYVGSPDLAGPGGANDGVQAKRQPGSSLKPFLYEQAFEELAMGPNTMLPDVDLAFATPDDSAYRPKNYDGRFHGPVLAREALGNSYNVPAVWLAERVGPARLLSRLRELGMCSLDHGSDHYGLGLALGDGEVRLLELARAYSTLARQGLDLPVRSVLEIERADGTVVETAPGTPRRVLDARATFQLIDILRDSGARVSSFGFDSALELPFEVAAKTGTSKGYRDNVAVGFTPEVTVAVWVGNFDGAPMHGVSGITGAGPLFHAAMLAASATHPPTPFVRPDGLDDVRVCTLSGGRPTGACAHARTELLRAGTAIADCDLHETVPTDPQNGLRAGPACADAVPSTFERFPPLLVSWARAAGRPLAPLASSPRCPIDRDPAPRVAPTVLDPPDGARFYLEDGAAGRAHVRLRASLPGRSVRVEYVVDGRHHAADGDGRATLALTAGRHVVRVVADGVSSEPSAFLVE
jgi:penicillin-binding protein 1C